MKKVLALLLAVMMLFSTLAFSSSAAKTNYKPSEASTALYTTLKQTGVINLDQAVLAFDAQNGTFFGKVNVYEGGKFQQMTGVTGVYYMIPDNINSLNTNLVPGRYVILPQVIAPVGKTFDGWYCYYDEEIYSAGSKFVIPGHADIGVSEFDGVIEFVAFYSPAPVEKDIFATIISVLIGIVAPLIAPLLGMTEDEILALVGGLFN